MITQLRSPLPWVGGKFYSAQRILVTFPTPESYDHTLSLWQRRRKECGEPVVEEEDILVFERRSTEGWHPRETEGLL